MAPLTQRKVTYAATVLGAGVLVVLAVLWASGGDPGLRHLAIAALVCLVPGRVNGWLWRPGYQSRRWLDLGRFAEAERAGTQAIKAFEARPWLRHARFLVGMVHTSYPEAMVRNNRAVARIGLGDLDRASGDLYHAVTIDPTYALAHANLAGLLAATGDAPGAAFHHREAVAMGLANNKVEGAMARLGGMLAAVEGR